MAVLKKVPKLLTGALESDALPGGVPAPHHAKTGQPFEASQSTIKTWRRCRKKYDYAFVQLLEPRKPKLPLIRGTMIGKCLDILAWDRTYPKAKRGWRNALEPFKQEFGRLFDEEKELYGDPIGEVERIVAKYEVIYANDGLTYLTPPGAKNGDPFEIPVRVDLAKGIVFTGHIDKMPRDKQDRVWDLDHKSHKSIPGPEDRYSDLQQVFYQWAMPLAKLHKPAGVIWDYLRTKPPVVPEQLVKGGLSQRQNMDTDYDTYFAEVDRLKLDRRDYVKMHQLLKPRGHMDFYQRVPLPHPSKILVETVVEEARETAIEMKQLGGVSTYRSMDRTCKSCQYFSLCQAEYRGLDANYIRKSEYQVQKDPRHVHLFEGDD